MDRPNGRAGRDSLGIPRGEGGPRDALGDRAARACGLGRGRVARRGGGLRSAVDGWGRAGPSRAPTRRNPGVVLPRKGAAKTRPDASARVFPPAIRDLATPPEEARRDKPRSPQPVLGEPDGADFRPHARSLGGGKPAPACEAGCFRNEATGRPHEGQSPARSRRGGSRSAPADSNGPCPRLRSRLPGLRAWSKRVRRATRRACLAGSARW